MWGPSQRLLKGLSGPGSGAQSWGAPVPSPGSLHFLLQAGVGDAPAGDAGPPLRHAVLGSPRGAAHVRAHPPGPRLVLLR